MINDRRMRTVADAAISIVALLLPSRHARMSLMPSDSAIDRRMLKIQDRKNAGPWTPCFVLFCSLAFLDPRVGHTMDVLSPFISILCHSD